MKNTNLLLLFLIGFTTLVSAQRIEDLRSPETDLVDGVGGSFSTTLSTFEQANDSATLTFIYTGDLGAGFEIIELFSEDSVKIGESLPQGADCAPPDSLTFRIPVDTINKWVADSNVRFIFDPDPGVGNFCVENWCQVRLVYPKIPVVNDATTQAVEEPLVFCSGTHDVVARIANFGSNQIDSVDVNWEVNGVAQPTHSLIALLDTLGGSFPHDTLLNLGAASFNAGANTIRVFTSNPNGGNDSIADNDTIDITIQTALNPINVRLFNPTQSSIDLDADNIAYQLDYEYGLSGFSLGTGTRDSSTTLPVTISGLSSGTEYEVYVRNNCDSSDVSSWVGPFDFITSFGTPYFQDFEAFAPGTVANPWPEGWKSTSTDPNQVRWESEDANGFNENDQNTGPLFDHTLFGQSGGDYIYFENGWFDLGEEATFISPPVEVPDSATSLEFSFWYFNFGTAVNRMEIYVDTNGVEDLVLTLAGQQQVAQTEDWREAVIYLNGYEGSSVVVKFRGYAHGSAREGDMAIDDVSIKEIPKENAAITDLIEPDGAICPGVINPIVAVQNTGVNDLTSVDVVSDINGVLDTTNFTFAATSTGDTVHLALPSVTFSVGVTYDLAFYPLMPNGLVDGDSLDDTLSFVGLTTGLAGSVTIDPGLAASTTNFTSFNALSNQVNSVGICGLVTVTVAAGTYTDNLRLIDVPGTSPTDRLIIDGQDQNSVRLRRGTNSLDATVIFQNASYVTIKNMTIENRNTGGEEWGAHFSRASHHDSIIDCYFDMGTGTFDVIGVGASAIITDDFTEGDNANWVTVMNCTIDGGAWGIKFEGPSDGEWNVGNSFINNRIINWDDGGMQTDQQDTLRVIRNRIELPRNNFADGMSHFEPMNFRMNQNYVFSNDIAVNISNANSAKFPDFDAQFINNMVISMRDPNSGFTGDVGVNMTNPSRIRIVHNSIWSEGTVGPAINLNGFAFADSLDVRNNAFSSENMLAFDMAGGGDTAVFLKYDNNLYYTGGLNLLDINGTIYRDLVSYQVVQPNFNIASIEDNPLWETDSSLVSAGVALNDAGDNSANILVDINGDPRPIAGATFVDIGAVEFDPPPCPAPSGLGIDVIDSDTANFFWISNVIGSTVEYEYVLSGNARGTGTFDTTSADTAKVGGLMENTDYDLYIREICRRGDTSIWIGPIAFTTPCAPSSAPFSENFDTGIDGTVPDCWAEYKTYDLAGAISGAKIENFNSFSAPNHLEINSWFGFNVGTDELYGVSPRILDLPNDNIEIKFQTATSDIVNNLFIGTTDVQGGGTITLLDTIFYSVNNTYQLEAVDITTANGYNGTDEYIVFMHSLGGTFDDIRIDDIDMDTIPSCREPRNPVASDPGPDSIVLSWIDLNGASSWQIEYDLNTLVLGNGADTIVTTEPATLKGLMANSTYQVAVRAICGAGDTSAWSTIITFETSCLPFTAKYTMNFDLQPINEPADCWAEYASYGLPQASAHVENVFPAQSGSRALVLDSWTGFGFGDQLVAYSPEFSDMINSNNQVEFWANTSDIINSLVVSTADQQGPNATLTPVDTISWVSANAWTNHVVFLDSANGYNGTDKYIAFSHSLSGTFDDIRIDDFDYDTMPSCPRPQGNIAINISSDSAELRWSDPAGASEWQIQIGAPGFTIGAATIDTITTMRPFTIDSLTPSTDYEFIVRSICAPGDTSLWSIRFPFTTLCAPFTAPYSMNFDTQTDGEVPECWAEYKTYDLAGVQSGAKVENFNSFSTPNHLEISSWFGFVQGTDDLAAISPQFTDLDSNNKRIRFQVTTNDITNELIIMTTDKQDGTGAFTAIDTIQITTANVYQQEESNITTANGYNGTDQYIAFAHSLDGTFDDIRIDDFVYEELPSCIRPSNLTANAISGDTVIIDWTEHNGATQWEIEFGFSGFVQGTGTTKLTSSKPDTLDTLTSGTRYELYIRSICAVGDTSIWEGPFRFQTLCDPIQTGFFTDFESTPLDTVPACWFGFASYGLPQAQPRVDNQFPGPIAGTRSLSLASWFGFTQGIDANFMITPKLGGVTAHNKRLRFMVETEDVINSLYVGTVSTQSTIVTPDWVDTIGFSSANVAKSVIIDLDSLNGYGGSDEYVIFSHSLDATFDGIVIDDLFYEDIPSCRQPDNFSSINLNGDSTEINWREKNGATQWEIEYDVSGFTFGNGTRKLTSNKPDTLNNLTAGTKYQVYIRSICTVGDTSSWAGPFDFQSLCEPLQSGFFTGFENTIFDSVPACWLGFASYGLPQAQPRVDNQFPGPIAGTRSLSLASWFGFTQGIDDNFMITPELGGITAHNKRLRFMVETEDVINDLFIGTVSSQSTVITPNWIDTVEFNAANVASEFIVDLDSLNSYNGTDQYVVFAHSLDATFDGIVIDDLRYEDIPSCRQPDNFSSVNLNGDSTEINWREKNGATEWEIEYGLSGFVFGNGTRNLTSNKPDTLMNLTSGTRYDVYIRSVCTIGDSSTWSGPFSFISECDDLQPGYFTNFESTPLDSVPSCWLSYASYGLPQSQPRVDNQFPGPIAGTRSLSLVSWFGFTQGVDDNFLITPKLGNITSENQRLRFMVETEDIINDLYVGTVSSQSITATPDWLDTISLSVANIASEFIVDLDSFNDYNGTDEYVIFAHSLDATFDGIVIDDMYYEDIPSCRGPEKFNATVLNGDSTELRWIDKNGATQWEIEYDLTGYVFGTGTRKITSSKPDTISNLMSGTRYDVYIRAICTVGDSSTWVGPLTFLTECEAILPGYFTDFESDPRDSIPTCWSANISYGTPLSQPRVDFGFPAPIFGSQSAYLNSWTGFTVGTSDNNFVTPELSGVTSGDKRLRFWTLTENTAASLLVGTASSPAATTIDWIDTVGYGSQGGGTQKEVLIDITTSNGYNGTDKYVVLAHDLGATFTDILVDDFIYEDIPTCIRPNSLATLGFDADTAELTWKDPNGATQWEIEYGASGFVLGTGTKLIVNNDTFKLSGLASGTRYDYYVRAICTVGDTSMWAGSGFEFCSGAVQPGYFTDFESDILDSLPICWAGNITYGTPQSQPRVENIFPGPIFGSQSAMLSSWFGFTVGTDDNNLVTPELGGITLEDKRIRFWALTENTTSSLLIGTAATQAATTIDWIDTVSFSNAGVGTHIEIVSNLDSVNGYNGTDEYVVLAHDLGGTFTEIVIDDFNYEIIPTCIRPDDLTAENFRSDSATIHWTDPNAATQWEVEYGLKGFTQGTGTLILANNDTIDIDGLSSGNRYEFYVRAICTVGDSSFWRKSEFEFCSGAVQAGYFTDFEDDPVDSIPTCWSANVTYGTPQSQPRVDDITNFPDPIFGARSAYLSSWFGFTQGVDDNNFVTPELGGITVQDKRVRFWTLTEDVTSSLLVGTASSPTATTIDWLDTVSYSTAGNGTQIEVTVNLDSNNGYNGTDEYVVLAHDLSSTFDGILIDDFTYEIKPSNCRPPNNLAVLDLDIDSATVKWNERNFVMDWEIQYGTSGFALGTGTTMKVTNDTVGIGGLMINTGYDFYVRTFCSTKLRDTSGWAGPLAFTTLDTIPCPVPYNLDTSNVTMTTADLSWSDSSGAALYEVEYDTANFPFGTGTIVLTSSQSLSITGLTVGTQYDFRVRTICGLSDTSLWSSTFNFRTDTNVVIIPCLAPTNLDTNNVAITSASVRWIENNTTPATEWEVEYGTCGYVLGTGTRAIANNASNFNITGLAAGTCYEFYARAICGPADTSVWSASGTFTTDTVVVVACTAPTGLDTSDVGPDSVFVSWNDPNAASQWELEYGTSGFTRGTGTIEIVNAPLPYEITGLTPNTSYDYYVRAICSAGDTSSVSDTANFTTDFPVGIRQDVLSLKNGLSVYPNPSNGLFTLNINLNGQQKLTVILRDVKGQLIDAKEVTVNGTYRDDLDYMGLAKGVYYLQVQSEDESAIKKLVIQ